MEPHPSYNSPGSHGPAIRQYNQDVQSGRIRFGSISGFSSTNSGFANRYPGHGSSEAGIRDFISSHRPLTMAVVASLLKTYEEIKAEINATILAKVGPGGFSHGWIHVGNQGNEARALHGKKVTGRTAQGNAIKGVYDHNSKQVLDKFGNRHDVTHIAVPDDAKKGSKSVA